MTQQTDRLNTALAGRYRIERHLGEGGMATVYLCEDLKHDRKVALKLLKPELAAVLGAERFVQEIKTTAALSHPHILPLFDSGTADGFLFYVMPYIKGETIREKLNRETQFGVEDAVRIAREVADALDYAHRSGVIHRDIKPENILLHDGRAMVMDFGIAIAVSAAAGGRMTETGLSLGTPHYMSPEQATAEKEITARSDVYSLGSVLYEMLTGNPPHTGASAQQIIMRIITDPARPVSEVRKSVPPNVVAAVAKSLEKLPADRFDTAAAFGAALANPAYSTGISASAPVDVARARRSRLREWVAWSMAAAGITWVTVLALRSAPPPVLRDSRFELTLPDSAPLAPPRQTPRVAISHDGSRIAYATDHGGVNAIVVRALADPVARQVAGTEGGTAPFFSPRGDWLAFITADRKLKKVPVGGGAAVVLADSAGPGSWSADGTIIYYAGPGGVYRVSAEGGTPTRVAVPDTTGGRSNLGQPVILPGDKYALLAVVRTGDAQLSVLRLADGVVTPLGVAGFSPRFDGGSHLLFGRSDGALYTVPFSLRTRTVTSAPVAVIQGLQQPTRGLRVDYAVADDGTLAFVSGPARMRQLMLVDRRGTARPLAADERAFGWPRVSPDGRRVATEIGEQGKPRYDIWVYDIASRNLNRVTSNSSGFRTAGWTQDGRRVFFLGPDSGGTAAGARLTTVRSMPWDGSGAADSLLYVPGYHLFEAMIGPPHTWIAIRTVESSGVAGATGDLSIAPLDSASKLRPFAVSPANESSPRLSPNGRFMAYVSDETGANEVYVRPVPGPGGRLKVSNGGGATPVWAPGGNELFYRTATHLISASLSFGAELAVRSRETLFEDPYYRDASPQFDVFPNGREFVFIRDAPGTGARLGVIINWQALLRKPQE